MYLKPFTEESHTPLHFRGKFLPVSLVRTVAFCTNTALYIFETLPNKKILYTYLNSALKVLLSSPIEVRGPKKKLYFVVQCYLCQGYSTIEKNEMGEACSAYGRGERRIQGFGGETWGKEITW